MKALAKFLGWLFVAAVLGGCEGLLFFPMKPLVRTPADVGVDYRDVGLVSSDGVELHGWWLPAKGEPRATVVFAHGNAENISTHLASVYWLPAEGINVLLVDYRGYGRSGGQPSVRGAIADIQAALDMVSSPGWGQTGPLVMLGQSLGASLAGQALAKGGEDYCARLARWPALRGVVLDAGFARYAEIAKDVASGHALTYLFQWPAAWAMPDGVDLVDAVPELAPLPLLVVQGKADVVVPLKNAHSIYAAAGQPKTLYLYEGGHIETFFHPGNRRRLVNFIAQLPPPSQCPKN